MVNSSTKDFFIRPYSYYHSGGTVWVVGSDYTLRHTTNKGVLVVADPKLHVICSKIAHELLPHYTPQTRVVFSPVKIMSGYNLITRTVVVYVRGNACFTVKNVWGLLRYKIY